jgi:hypothetical protein
VVALHNFSDSPVEDAAKIELQEGERLLELLGKGEYVPIDGSPALDLDAYGCRWFRICGRDKRNM